MWTAAPGWIDGADNPLDGIQMTEIVDALVLDLLTFVAERDRSYGDVMEAWRTSCPRLPVWEEAHDRGLVVRILESGQAIIRLTPAGEMLLRRHDRLSATNAVRNADGM